MKKIYIGVLAALVTTAITTPLFISAAPDLESALDTVKSKYMFDGPIYDTVTDGETLYIGGGFETVTEQVGALVQYTESTDTRDTSFPQVTGEGVYAVVSDGDGGWFIGGYFDTVGGEPRDRVAHILSDGSVDSNFAPTFTDPDDDYGVRALAYDAATDVVYVGGSLYLCEGTYDEEEEECSGTEYRNLIAFDATTGELANFVSQVAEPVYALALSSDGATLYVGGSFWEVYDAEDTEYDRPGLASFDTQTGAVNDFDPYITAEGSAGTVYTLSLSSDDATIYAGGYFGDVNDGTPRNYLAAFDADTGVATAFNPDPNYEVYATRLSPDGNLLYVGGGFVTIGGEDRTQFAAIDTTTGLVTALDADITSNDDTVYAIALSSDGETIYIGGDGFASFGAEERSNFAEIDAGTGVVTSFDPNLTSEGSNTVRALAVDGGMLVIGGEEWIGEAVDRSEVAAIDLSTYELTDFDPDVLPHNETTTYALELSGDGSILYIGGNIDGVNGGVAERSYLAAVTTADGLATDFNPSLNYIVYDLVLSSDDATLYAGGSFTGVNEGTERLGLAAFDTETSLATAFDPGEAFSDPNNEPVRALALSSDDATLYAGGSGLLQGFNAETGATTDVSWVTDESIYALALSSDDATLYVGGDFTETGLGTGEGLVFDEANGSLETFPIVASMEPGTIYAAVPDGEGGWYITGDFISVGEVEVDGIAHILSDGTLDTDFLPSLDGAAGFALALSSDGGTLYVGGDILTVNGGTVRRYVAAFDTDDGSVLAFNPLEPAFLNGSTALALSPDDTVLYVGSTGWEGGCSLFAFDTATGDPTGLFDCNSVWGSVNTITLSGDGDTLYVGGDFTLVDNGGTPRNRIAAFDTDDGSVLAFDPDSDGTVYSLLLNEDESLLYAGGSFGMIGEDARSEFAAIDTTTGEATALDAQIAGNPETVLAIGLSSDEETVYIGGESFITVGGASREYFAAIDATTGLATDLDFALNGTVYSINASEDGNVFVGGSFTQGFGVSGRSLFAIDTAENEIAEFSPDTLCDSGGGSLGSVYDFALSADDELLYVGGYFTHIGEYDEDEEECSGEPRSGLAVFDTTDSSLGDFAPTSFGGETTIFSLLLSPEDDELYVGINNGGLLYIFDTDEEESEEEPPAEEEEDNGGGGSFRRHTIVPSGISSNQSAIKAILEQLVLVLQQLIQELLAQQQN